MARWWSATPTPACLPSPTGPRVSATTLDVGDQASGAGIVTVSGPNADLITTGTVTVGDAGSGELSILDGANANIGGDLNVANAGTGTGNVDIEDTTGTITFGGNILVGFNGFGVFNIGFDVDYIQNSGGIIFGPDSSGAINSFADPSPFLSNSSPSPISIGAQGVDQLAAYLFNSGEFTIPNNHSLTFETPIISGGGSFALGSGDSLVLNADTVTGQTFTLGSNDKLTIGIDQLATIDVPAERHRAVHAGGEPEQGRSAARQFRRGDCEFHLRRHDRCGHVSVVGVGGDAEPERLGGVGDRDRQRRPRWGC